MIEQGIELVALFFPVLVSDDAGDCAAAVKKQQLARSIAASFRGMFIRVFFRLVIVDEGTACKGFTQLLQAQFSPTNVGQNFLALLP